jgi:hypothetical protein
MAEDDDTAARRPWLPVAAATFLVVALWVLQPRLATNRPSRRADRVRPWLWSAVVAILWTVAPRMRSPRS